MMRIVLGLALSACALAAMAASPRVVLKRVEMSMLVHGKLVVAPDGSVASYSLDRAEDVPEAVRSLLQQVVPTWQLEGATRDGRPLASPLAAEMSIKLVARQTGDPDQMDIMVRDTTFWDPNLARATGGSKANQPPKYPKDAYEAGMSGIVYVVLRLNPDGTVADAHAEQVDMTVLASDAVLRRYRDVLAQAALRAARQWTFNIQPQRLEEPGPIAIRLPVEFALSNAERPRDGARYGTWQAYVPGPRKPAPWQARAARGKGSLDPGELYPLDSAITLRAADAGR